MIGRLDNCMKEQVSLFLIIIIILDKMKLHLWNQFTVNIKKNKKTKKT